MSAVYASAVSAYVQAGAARIPLRLHDGRVRVGVAPEAVPAPLVVKLRRHKIDLAEILAGNVCRHCGDAIEWREPGAVIFADGTGAHLRCYEAAGGVPLAALGNVP